MVSFEKFIDYWEKEGESFILRSAKECGCYFLVATHMNKHHLSKDRMKMELFMTYRVLMYEIRNMEIASTHTNYVSLPGFRFPLTLAINDAKYFSLLLFCSACISIERSATRKDIKNLSYSLLSFVVDEFKKNRTFGERIKTGLWRVIARF